MIEKRITKIRSNKNRSMDKYQNDTYDIGRIEKVRTVSFDPFRSQGKITHLSIIEVIS